MARYLWPSQKMGLLLMAGVAFAAVEAHHVRLIHEQRHSREALCRAELKALKARNLYVEHYLVPADPCRALSLLGTP